MISFTLNIEPPATTAQQKGERVVLPKHGKPFIGHYTKKKVAQAALAFGVALAPHRIPTPMVGPILLTMTFVYPWRKSEPKRNRLKNIMPKFTIPDVDNSAKLIIDVMTKQKFWNDDGQIADLHLRKYWGNHPGITILAYEMNEEEEA